MITKEQVYKTLEKLIERFYDHIDTYKKGYYNETQTRVDYIKQIPLPNDFPKNLSEKIIKLVDNLLKLNKKLEKKLETQRKQLQRAIDYSERKIDEVVYELYWLSKKEINVIEKISD